MINLRTMIPTKAQTYFVILICCIIGIKVFAQVPMHENLGPGINTEFAENSPTISPDGKTLYFIRWTENEEGDEIYDLWQSELGEDGIWQEATLAGKPFDVYDYDNIASIARNGKSMLISGAFEEGVYMEEGFSMTFLTNEGWSKPQKIDIRGYPKMKKGKYTSAELSNDGTVLILTFSEKKDSQESDIYVCFLKKDSTWSKPKNVGKDLNTKYSETSVYLSADMSTLYFSSNRPGGVGCYDTYMSTRLDDTWMNWSEPVNLGTTVNSDVCDLHFSIDANEEYAYFGSIYESEYGQTEIVRVKLVDSLKPPKKLVIEVSETNEDTVLINSTDSDMETISENEENKRSNETTQPIENMELSIYPNPTDGNFLIELESDGPIGIGTIFITDITGKVREQQQINHTLERYTQRFDLTAYPKGIYFVQMVTSRGKQSKRFILK